MKHLCVCLSFGLFQRDESRGVVLLTLST
uniref:Uncharacterized protein n=1 Tax=Tetraselmis sp. GSL018 TaxID=582737 RepID=A0A061RGH0_9CHLO